MGPTQAHQATGFQRVTGSNYKRRIAISDVIFAQRLIPATFMFYKNFNGYLT